MATASPDSLSTPLYTWPREAAAMGPSEMLENTEARGRPSSSSMVANACGMGDLVEQEAARDLSGLVHALQPSALGQAADTKKQRKDGGVVSLFAVVLLLNPAASCQLMPLCIPGSQCQFSAPATSSPRTHDPASQPTRATRQQPQATGFL